MGINRRQFSTMMAVSLLAPQLFASQRRPLLASAAQVASEGYALLVLDTAGETLWQHSLPARAHHVEHHPKSPLLAVVGRRPETFIDVVNYQEKRLVKRIQASPGQHFYGHAVFTDNGRFLISTENEVHSGKGLISIRDAYDDFQITNQFYSGGIGPHELKVMPDQETLIVANGGIQTHPEQGRAKLNLDRMHPSLAYLHLPSGKLLEQVFMPEERHQLSIRHFDINHQGHVAIGLQYQGDKRDDVPLVAFHKRGHQLELVRAPAAVNAAMKQYCGSVRFDQSGEYAAISSPRGNLVTFWHPAKATFTDHIKSRDGCGVARTSQPGEFLISTGRGYCYRYNLLTQQKEKLPLKLGQAVSWDNHLHSFY